MKKVSTKKVTFRLKSMGLIAFSFFIIFTQSCKKIEMYLHNHQPSKSDSTKFTVHTNVADPMLAEAKLSNGTIIDFYGTKDIETETENLTQVILKSETDTIYYLYDDQHRLIQMIGKNGTSFTYNWETSTKAAVTISVPAEHAQINTEYDFVNQATAAQGTLVINHTIKTRPKTPLKLTFKGHSLHSNLINQAVETSSIQVSVQQCGLPSYGQVYVDVIGTVTGINFGRFPGYQVQTGLYNVSLPTSDAPTFDAQENCESVANALEYACVLTEFPGYETFCAYLDGIIIIGTDGITAPAAAAIFELCESGSEGLKTICETVGASPTEGAPSIADEICNSSVFKNLTFTEDVRLTPLVIALPNDIYGLSETSPKNGPFP